MMPSSGYGLRIIRGARSVLNLNSGGRLDSRLQAFQRCRITAITKAATASRYHANGS
jgi:hypothetical protein